MGGETRLEAHMGVLAISDTGRKGCTANFMANFCVDNERVLLVLYEINTEKPLVKQSPAYIIPLSVAGDCHATLAMTIVSFRSP